MLPLLLGAALGCGSTESNDGSDDGNDDATSTEVTIGSDGGDLTVEGARLTIPAGALSTETEISLRVGDDEAPVLSEAVPASPLYEIGPDDVVLDVPATLTISFDPDPQQLGAATIYSAPTGGTADEFMPVPTIPVGSDEVSASLEHFSVWGVFFQNTPGGSCPPGICGDPSVECLLCGIPLCVEAGSVCCEAGNVCSPDAPLCMNCPAGSQGDGGIGCGVDDSVCCNGVICGPPLTCTDCGDGRGPICTTGC